MMSQNDLIYKKKYLKYKEKYLRLQQRLQRGGELTKDQINKILTVLLSIKYIDKKRKELKEKERHAYKVSAITYALGLMNCISRFRYLKNEGDANPLIQMNTDAFNDLMVQSYRNIQDNIIKKCCDEIQINDTGYQIIEEILYEEFKTITILEEANKELLDKLVNDCEVTIEELTTNKELLKSRWSSNDTDQLNKDIADKTRAIIQYASQKEEEKMRQQTTQQAKQPIDLRREQLAQRETERQLEAETERQLEAEKERNLEVELEEMRKRVEEKELHLEAISGNVTPESLEKQAEQLAKLGERFQKSPNFKGSESSSSRDSSGRGSAIQNSPGPQRRLLGLAQGPVSRTPEPPSPLPSRLRQPRTVQPSEVPVKLEEQPQLQPERQTISRPAATRAPPPTITFTPPASASDAYASLNDTIARIKAEQEQLGFT